jgi:hypothetical protein
MAAITKQAHKRLFRREQVRACTGLASEKRTCSTFFNNRLVAEAFRCDAHQRARAAGDRSRMRARAR